MSHSSRKRAPLSKTRYCLGLKCPKALYYEAHGHPKEVALKKRRAFEYGRIVETAARKAYEPGVLIGREDGVRETRAAMQSGARSIFEATFVAASTVVRVDILRNNGDRTWDIVEIKQSRAVKEEHLPDMAVQWHVAELSGVAVKRVILRHLNGECAFPRLESLFLEVDCTDRVREEKALVAARLEDMVAMLEAPVPPEMSIGPWCDTPYPCDFKATCWAHVPPHSVFELMGVHLSDKSRLFHSGTTLISQLPDDTKVPRARHDQVVAVKTGLPRFDRAGLDAFFSGTEYPVHFFDFESLDPPIPALDGARPGEHIPYQFSCHTLRSPDATPEHRDYLHAAGSDPRPAIIEALLEALGDKGTIFAYFSRFEMEIIARLAACFPARRERLLALLPRFKDLHDVFKRHYTHPDFRGSNSLKSVLPVLVPSMSYEGMEIGNGILAQYALEKLLDAATPPEERATIEKSLRHYCRQDTLALVEIFRVLRSQR